MNLVANTAYLSGARAFILHRPHVTVQAISRQLAMIGLEVTDCWPEPPASILGADFVFFDVDHGFDDQFPWKPGEAPMPLIALIGSEAPGRIEWALSHGAAAQLLKPVGNAGVYSALLIARQTFDARRRLANEISSLRRRMAERQTVVRAVALLSARGLDEERAYAQLRSLAMTWRITIEDAASRILAMRQGDSHDRTHCP